MRSGILSSSVRRIRDKSRSSGTYFFLFGFEVGRLPLEADFAAVAGFVFALALLTCGLDVVFDADFAGVEPFGLEPTFAGVFDPDAAFTGATAVFPATTVLPGGDVALAGTVTFLATSVLSGFGTSFAAAGFAGFFFGGNCNSAKRSMTSSIDCSESA